MEPEFFEGMIQEYPLNIIFCFEEFLVKSVSRAKESPKQDKISYQKYLVIYYSDDKTPHPCLLSVFSNPSITYQVIFDTEVGPAIPSSWNNTKKDNLRT